MSRGKVTFVIMYNALYAIEQLYLCQATVKLFSFTTKDITDNKNKLAKATRFIKY